MAAFRPLGQFVQYLTDSGDVNAGGTIETFETDLTTNKLTYSDPALTVANPFIIPLDAFGRPSVDVWGDGAYGMVMKTALGVTIKTLNNIQSDSPVVDQIPALVADQFLTNNGSILLWSEVIQVPDPTGLANYVLTSDGDNAVWTAPAVVPTPEAIVTYDATKWTISDGLGTTMLTQMGTGSAPASGSRVTQVSVTYPIPFTTPFGPPKITQTNSGSTSNGSVCSQTVTAFSATGFTVKFNISADDSRSQWDITSDVTFAYEALGVYPTP